MRIKLPGFLSSTQNVEKSCVHHAAVNSVFVESCKGTGKVHLMKRTTAILDSKESDTKRAQRLIAETHDPKSKLKSHQPSCL